MQRASERLAVNLQKRTSIFKVVPLCSSVAAEESPSQKTSGIWATLHPVPLILPAWHQISTKSSPYLNGHSHTFFYFTLPCTHCRRISTRPSDPILWHSKSYDELVNCKLINLIIGLKWQIMYFLLIGHNST